MNDLPVWQKAAIGAVGGIALAVLKLIEAKFYLNTLSSVEAHAAYLTYFCYMLLGSVAAVFLTDNDLPPPKVKRGAFVLGLLAPSVLLALANQPFKPEGAQPAGPAGAIPALGWLPLPSAMAQTAATRPAPGSTPRFEMLRQSELQPDFGEAFSAALGRSKLSEPYALVVGSTKDRAKADETVARIQALFASQPGGTGKLAPKVVQVAGEDSYFVVLGGMSTAGQLTQLKSDATAAAIHAIQAPSSPASSSAPALSVDQKRAVAALLANAPVVPARNLSVSKQ